MLLEKEEQMTQCIAISRDHVEKEQEVVEYLYDYVFTEENDGDLIAIIIEDLDEDLA
jgi:hypothetical protein